jgi:drug/metabolite transporter (DMT)-like permease
LILVALVLARPFEHPRVDTGTAVAAILSVAFLGVVGTGAATFLFNRLIQQQGPLFAGMATNVVPIGALVLAWLDSEHVSGLQLAALAGLVCMVAVVQFAAVRRTGD